MHLNGVVADGNLFVGIWLDGSPANSIMSFEANDNGVAGVYVGCGAGPTDVACPPGRLSSNGNVISGVAVASSGSSVETNSTASATISPLQPFGVAIDLDSLGNLVTLVTAHGNRFFDMEDLNPHCGSNEWLGNSFDPGQTKPAVCIH